MGGIIVVGSHTAKTTSPVRVSQRKYGHRILSNSMQIVSDEERFANEVDGMPST